MNTVYYHFESTHPLESSSRPAQPRRIVRLYKVQSPIQFITFTIVASGNIIEQEQKADCSSVLSCQGHDGKIK
jgi:hypothetical protein